MWNQQNDLAALNCKSSFVLNLYTSTKKILSMLIHVHKPTHPPLLLLSLRVQLECYGV